MYTITEYSHMQDSKTRLVFLCSTNSDRNIIMYSYSPQVHLLVPRRLLHHQCLHSGEGVPASLVWGENGPEVVPHSAGTGVDWWL